MITRTALLYLARQESLKDFVSRFDTFRRLTQRFIPGEDIDQVLPAIRELNASGIAASFDHLGESITSRADAEAEVREYVRLLGRIEDAGIDSNVSVKLTQLGLDIDEEFCRRNALAIVEAAARHSNFVRIDMEDSPRTDATLRVFRSIRGELENVGIVIQSYLYRSEADTVELLGRKARIRLCKGAYDEPREVGFEKKKDVDANYVRIMKLLLKSGIYHGIATHDEVMISATRDFAEREGIPKSAFEFQMLYGVRRDIQQRLISEGYRVRVYVPYGGYWYPYFMRRLAERPANIWFVLKNLFK